MNRIWQCGTIQLDMNLPERFDVTYIDDKGEKSRPVMIHRACFGSIERFVGVITEHFAGAFPLWIAPEQVHVLPVNNEFHLEFSKKVVEELKKVGIRAHLVDASEKLGYRMRNAQVKKVPYTLVIGDNELNSNSVTYRHYGSKEQINIPLADFVKKLVEEISSRSLPKVEE